MRGMVIPNVKKPTMKEAHLIHCMIKADIYNEYDIRINKVFFGGPQ